MTYCQRIRGAKYYLYSKETYNLLNYLTLDIKDPQIQAKLDDQRCKNFKSLFVLSISLQFLFMLIFVPFYWRDFFTGRALQDYVQLSNVLVWVILHFCKP